MIEIVNKQRKVKLEISTIESFVKNSLELIKESGNRAPVVVFVSDAKMKSLNSDFRRIDHTTDVLSFPFEAEEFEKESAPLGDIVISVEQAARQAAENDLSFELELKQLILHGILHLCGYDHEIDNGEMDAREGELRNLLKIED
ncbi:MAG: rRNA maturation RNase YbeY [Pyrinomonadaceae bacterium]|nr:rRNA maturation RNase YbeY [Pyrinomonadaceae bacterium]